MLSEQTQLNIAHEYLLMRQSHQETQYAQQAPHVLMRPKVYPDGDKWCALYGGDIQEGVVGFGVTPEHACADFDLNWRQQSIGAPKSLTVRIGAGAIKDSEENLRDMGIVG